MFRFPILPILFLPRFQVSCVYNRLFCHLINEYIERKFEMYQQLTLIGHLGADPVMRYTPSGVSVTTFRL
ncbi:MAG: single-stranded DNA-binding protein, partial [Caldilineaceae bacterium]|nr:single-stranded DNA-binding protein [Caldilineaceae bacterium]